MLTFLLHQAAASDKLQQGAKQAALLSALDLLSGELRSVHGFDFANADIWGPCIVRCVAC